MKKLLLTLILILSLIPQIAGAQETLTVTVQEVTYMKDVSDGVTVTATITGSYTSLLWEYQLADLTWYPAPGTNNEASYAVPGDANEGTKYRITATGADATASAETYINIIEKPIIYTPITYVQACRNGTSAILQAHLDNQEGGLYSHEWQRLNETTGEWYKPEYGSSHHATWSFFVYSDPNTQNNCNTPYANCANIGDLQKYRCIITSELGISQGVTYADTSDVITVEVVEECPNVQMYPVITTDRTSCTGDGITLQLNFTNYSGATIKELEISTDAGSDGAIPVNIKKIQRVYNIYGDTEDESVTRRNYRACGNYDCYPEYDYSNVFPKMLVREVWGAETVSTDFFYRNVNEAVDEDASTVTLRAWVSNIDGTKYDTYESQTLPWARVSVDLSLGCLSPAPTIARNYIACAEEGLMDLNELLAADTDTTGIVWYNEDGVAGVHLFDKSIPGTRTYSVTNKKAGQCESAASEVTVTIVDYPSISTDLSADYYICEGDESATLSIAADNVVNYQWQSRANETAEWADITDAENTGSYAVPAGTADGTQFQVILSNVDGSTVCGQITSATATVHVAAKPNVTLDLESRYCVRGEAPLLSVTAESATGGSLLYQWQVLSPAAEGAESVWQDITGETNSSYQVPAGTADGTKFRLAIANAWSGESSETLAKTCDYYYYSTEAVIYADPEPSISTDLATNYYMCAGVESISLEVNATSTSTGSTLAYQWQEKGPEDADFIDILEATNPTYAVPSDTENGTQYRVAVANSWSAETTGAEAVVCNYVYSTAATVNVASAPSITDNLNADYYMCPGDESLSLSVTAAVSDGTGSGLAYQWQEKGPEDADFIDILEATNPTYAVPSDAENGTQYRVAVANTWSEGTTGTEAITCNYVYSNVATVNVALAPSISTDLNAGYDMCVGVQSISLSVTAAAENGNALVYQWQEKGPNDPEFTDIIGANEADYDVPASTVNATQFRVGVANKWNAETAGEEIICNYVYSTAATITVHGFTPLTVEDYNECAVPGSMALSELVTSEYSSLIWYDEQMNELADATFDTYAAGTTVYYVSSTLDGSCASEPAKVTVSITYRAVAEDISVTDYELCAGDAATLTASTTLSDSDLAFKWYSDAELTQPMGSGASLDITVPAADATYYVTLQGAASCENLPGEGAAVNVTVNTPLISAVLLPESEDIGIGRDVVKTLELDPSGTDYSAVWTANGSVIDPDAYFPIKLQNDAEYKVVVTDECGRVFETSASVTVGWPTILTPYNVDGINDDFLCEMGDVYIEVFTRKGTRVFVGNHGWDHASIIQNAPGVYFYYAVMPDGVVKRGTVEIYR